MCTAALVGHDYITVGSGYPDSKLALYPEPKLRITGTTCGLLSRLYRSLRVSDVHEQGLALA